jgi:hypothetical protein
MGVVRQLVNYQIKYYQKGSIFSWGELGHNIDFYLPLRKTLVCYGDYSSKHKEFLVDNSLEFLGDGVSQRNDDENKYYLVLEDIVTFNINNYMNLDNNADPCDLDELETSYLSELFEDVSDWYHLTNFDNLGISSFNVNCIIEEHWSQSFGDFDCYTKYIGVINTDINSEELVIDKSKKRLKEIEEVQNHQYDGIEDYMALYSSYMTEN